MKASTTHSWLNRGLTLIVLNLLAIASVLWFLTVAETRITDIPPNGFGFVAQLPFYFWIGFACVLASAAIVFNIPEETNSYLELLIGLLLVVYVFGTPQFTYENVRIQDIYGVIRSTKQAIAEGHVNIGAYEYGGGMSLFPSIAIVLRISTEILGISAEAVARWYPLYMMTILGLFAYCMARQVRGRTIIAVLTAIAFTWTQEYNLAPQAYALILYATLWGLLIKTHAVKEKRHGIGNEVLIILLISAIVVTHIGTPVFLLFNLWLVGFMVLAANRLFSHPQTQSDTRERILTTAMFATVLWLTWLVYVAEPSFQSIIRLVRNAVQETVRGNIVPIPDFSGSSAPEPRFAFVNRIRVYLTLIQVTLGLFSIAILWIKRQRWLASLLGMWFISCFATVLSSMASYAQLYISRPLLVSLVPLAPLVGACFSFEGATLDLAPRKTGFGEKIWQAGIVIILIASIASLPFTRYNGDAAEYSTSSTLAALAFTLEHNLRTSVPVLPDPPTGTVLKLDSNRYNYYLLWGRQREYAQWLQDNVNPVYIKIYDSGESAICIRKQP